MLLYQTNYIPDKVFPRHINRSYKDEVSHVAEHLYAVSHAHFGVRFRIRVYLDSIIGTEAIQPSFSCIN